MGAKLVELGARVIDADLIARQVVEKESEAYREIVAHFGAGILDDEGNINRVRLGEIVFSDEEARQKLNAITHPRVMAEVARQAAGYEQAGADLVFLDAALLVEGGFHRGLNALVVVSATEEQQVARIKARDGLPRADALARIQAQKPLSDKVAVADYIIDNSGDLNSTWSQVQQLIQDLTDHGRVGDEKNG